MRLSYCISFFFFYFSIYVYPFWVPFWTREIITHSLCFLQNGLGKETSITFATLRIGETRNGNWAVSSSTSLTQHHEWSSAMVVRWFSLSSLQIFPFLYQVPSNIWLLKSERKIILPFPLSGIKCRGSTCTSHETHHVTRFPHFPGSFSYQPFPSQLNS